MYGDYRGAASAAREAFDASQQMDGPQPQAVAAYKIRLAHPLAFVGETARALELLSSPMPGDPRSVMSSSFEGLRLLWLGDAYRESGASAQAEQAYDRAIAYLGVHGLPHSAALGMAYEGKALLLARERRFAAAVPAYRLAIAGYLNSGTRLTARRSQRARSSSPTASPLSGSLRKLGVCSRSPAPSSMPGWRRHILRVSR
ncbi:MAG TPA: hypothetical protein VFA39_22210 [Steroidobacteraceae bacterium]|nr:hypothetical protein [Steroidobacteraceae bacterium]